MILSNPKAEMMLVATCLDAGAECARAAAADVVPDDFADLTCQSAWLVILALLESGQRIDLPNFDVQWRRQMPAGSVPLDVYKGMDSARTAGELDQVIAEVKEWSRRRAIHLQALQLAKSAADGKTDIEAAWLSCQDKLRILPKRNDLEAGPEESVAAHLADLEYRMSLDGKLSGISTGFSFLDSVTDGFQKQELSIVGGRPHHGKSALLMCFARNVSFVQHQPTLFITLEMPLVQLMRRLNALETDVSLRCMKRGKLSEFDLKKITGFGLRLKNAPLWVVNGIGRMDGTRFRHVVRRYAEEKGVVFVVVDYLQKLKPSMRHEKRTYEISEVCESLKVAAVEHKIHVCAAAQLNREPDKAQGKEKGRFPKMADLADSGQIEREADLILLLHRKDEEANLLIAKQRDGEEGVQHLWFNRDLCRFEETHHDHPDS